LEAAVRAHGAGRVQEAAAAYAELLRSDPATADLMQRFGVALAELAAPEEGRTVDGAFVGVAAGRPTVLVNLARPCSARPNEAALSSRSSRKADGTVGGGIGFAPPR